MILQTGGLAIGLTSTRSSPNSPAFSSAASRVRTPSCSPAGPTTRSSRARIRRLVLWSRAMRHYLLKRKPDLVRSEAKTGANILAHSPESSALAPLRTDRRPASRPSGVLRRRRFLGEQAFKLLQLHRL